MTTLFINVYNDGSNARGEELNHCLVNNLSSFDRIVAINNTGYEIEGIVNIMTPIRPTFKDFFAAVNEFSDIVDINVIANSDIYFDKDSVAKFNQIKENECFALSRYNDGFLFLRCDSQDAWVFRGWIKHIDNADFNLGKPGSDNSIAHRISSSGYTLKNPCFDIRPKHLHESNIRNYSSFDQTPMPYMNVYPTDLKGCRRFYATSINPFDRLEEQLQAIATWKNGIVISFNTKKEIEVLGGIKGITFVELSEEDIINGKYPRIAAITKWTKYLDFDRFILINSDISIDDANAFLKAMLSTKFVMGVRHDDGKEMFSHGYDVFAFTKSHILNIIDTKYALGLPWWDFYVPLALINKGFEIDVIKQKPVFTHVLHETRYDYNKWTEMGEYFKSTPDFNRLISGYTSLPEICTATKKFIDERLNVIG